jgi:hypothetical protein
VCEELSRLAREDAPAFTAALADGAGAAAGTVQDSGLRGQKQFPTRRALAPDSADHPAQAWRRFSEVVTKSAGAGISTWPARLHAMRAAQPGGRLRGRNFATNAMLALRPAPPTP